jgi:hypothetical protein
MISKCIKFIFHFLYINGEVVLVTDCNSKGAGCDSMLVFDNFPCVNNNNFGKEAKISINPERGGSNQLQANVSVAALLTKKMRKFWFNSLQSENMKFENSMNFIIPKMKISFR